MTNQPIPLPDEQIEAAAKALAEAASCDWAEMDDTDRAEARSVAHAAVSAFLAAAPALSAGPEPERQRDPQRTGAAGIRVEIEGRVYFVSAEDRHYNLVAELVTQFPRMEGETHD